MKTSFRDTFLIYEVLRKAFLFGLNFRPILKALDARPGEKILDAGCGFGFLHKYFQGCDYTGIDCDSARIEWAVRNIGESSSRRFRVLNICTTGFPDRAFDKVICYGLLHHLSGPDAELCLKELARVSRGRVVFADPVYSDRHFISNLLCRMDRGEFVRRAEDYRRLCRAHFPAVSEQFFYSNNFIAKYFLMTACPNPEPNALYAER